MITGEDSAQTMLILTNIGHQTLAFTIITTVAIMLAPPGSALDAILGIGVYLNASTKPPKGRLLFGKRILLLKEQQLELDAGAMLMHARLHLQPVCLSSNAGEFTMCRC